MSDLISRSALKKNVTDGWLKGEEADTHITFVYEADVDNAPTIEAAPVNHGRWTDVNGDGSLWRCSICGETQCCKSDYCGDCGARMDEVEE